MVSDRTMCRFIDSSILLLTFPIGIASVKSYTWENPFYDLINSFRLSEEACISESQTLKSYNFALFSCVTPVASFATFVVYKATGGTLTLPIVYSTASLLLVLRTSIGRQWTRSIETGSEALSASSRIENFLEIAAPVASERRGAAVRTILPPEIGDEKEYLLLLKNANFTYSSLEELTAASCTLKYLNLSVSAGELVIVVGAVGAGKSSLLTAILEEMTLVKLPSDQSEGAPLLYQKAGIRIAYCSQRPWILATTVKSNIIIAGKNKDAENNGEDIVDRKNSKYSLNVELYENAINSCNLLKDFQRWPWYDETEIGKFPGVIGIFFITVFIYL